MPRRDGMGPMGMGPMSGRGFGPCGGRGAFGYGYGFGPRRMGRPGWGPGAYYDAPLNRRDALKEQKEMLKEQMAWINEELKREEE